MIQFYSLYFILFFLLFLLLIKSSPINEDDWEIEYTGYGSITFDQGKVTLIPQASISSGETHAGLVLSKQTWAEFKVTVIAKTNSQLRTPTPNSWEVFWLFFNYKRIGNEKETNYFILKTNGIELGTASETVAQNFLETDSTPTINLGQNYQYTVEMKNGLLNIWIDSNLVIQDYDFIQSNPDKNLYTFKGMIGLYTEDASVTISDFNIESYDTSSSFIFTFSFSFLFLLFLLF
ncbi:hypothetical protein M0811_14482 [Anaeramoeba ignava]|uniref:Uncharacterized protein n=1 Tax=Anaeramoeba ignava TaxID=1746090 RepID=A0A9Q0LVM8_ANAIG|nr:hypothetical protein M0811_14482 [Anaeramoeba ignava]